VKAPDYDLAGRKAPRKLDEALLWASALWFAMTDPVSAFNAVAPQTWAAFLVARGWLSHEVRQPSGVVRYFRRPGEALVVRVYEGEYDAGTRYDDTARKLANAMGVKSEVLVASLLVFQHALTQPEPEVVDAVPEGASEPSEAPRSVLTAPSPAALPAPRRPVKQVRPVEAFLGEHPALLDVLGEVGRREVQRGARRIDVRGLVRIVRDTPKLAKRVCPRGGKLTLNHYHTPELGRLLVTACPDLAPFLRLRRRLLGAMVVP